MDAVCSAAAIGVTIDQHMHSRMISTTDLLRSVISTPFNLRPFKIVIFIQQFRY